jgi:hypothetical protein
MQSNNKDKANTTASGQQRPKQGVTPLVSAAGLGEGETLSDCTRRSTRALKKLTIPIPGNATSTLRSITRATKSLMPTLVSTLHGSNKSTIPACKATPALTISATVDGAAYNRDDPTRDRIRDCIRATQYRGCTIEHAT